MGANVGRILAPTDSPQLAEFMAALDEINARAEATPGFIWRLQSDSGNATDIRVSEDPNFLINMSVWATIEPPARTDAAGIHVQSALPAARGAGQPAGHETRTVLRRLALI